MTFQGWAEIALTLSAACLLGWPLGVYLSRVWNGETTWLDPVLRPVEPMEPTRCPMATRSPVRTARRSSARTSTEHSFSRRTHAGQSPTHAIARAGAGRGWATRAELAGLLWPDQESKLAFTNLRKTLFRLPALPGAPAAP